MTEHEIVRMVDEVVESILNDESVMDEVVSKVMNGVEEEKVVLQNKTLCPKIWSEDKKLNPEVRDNLLKIAMDFYKDTEIKAQVQDVYFLGSVANYNWTPKSDVDLHILIDISELALPPDYAKKSLKAISTRWNMEHEIKIHGHPIEVYIQDIRETNRATGVYSLVQDAWVKEPHPQDISVDESLIQHKYSLWVEKIKQAVSQENVAKMKKLLEDLMSFREAGLTKGGEFSTENIVFKLLRARKQIEKLKDTYNHLYDKHMSVSETTSTHTRRMDEGFDPTSMGPNPEATEGQPPNPNFYQNQIDRMRQLEEAGQQTKDSKYFTAYVGDERAPKSGGVIQLKGDPQEKDNFANFYRAGLDWGTMSGKVILNRHTGAFAMKLPDMSYGFNNIEDMLAELDKWYEENQQVKEGYGPGDPDRDKDRLTINNEDGSVRRWMIKSKNAPRTPKMNKFLKEIVDEALDKVFPMEEGKDEMCDPKDLFIGYITPDLEVNGLRSDRMGHEPGHSYFINKIPGIRFDGPNSVLSWRYRKDLNTAWFWNSLPEEKAKDAFEFWLEKKLGVTNPILRVLMCGHPKNYLPGSDSDKAHGYKEGETLQ